MNTETGEIRIVPAGTSISPPWQKLEADQYAELAHLEPAERIRRHQGWKKLEAARASSQAREKVRRRAANRRSAASRRRNGK